jgi:hypothetical protein
MNKRYFKKRYLIASLLTIYVIAKIYVSFTENPNDDDIPDRIKDIVFRVVMVSPTDDPNPDFTVEY